jgi:PTH1 family peptidyl-tRNA hydrolase
MHLIAGLGNPGAKYRGTRHNVGFEVVDELARRHRGDWAQAPRGIDALVAKAPGALLVKPLTFMNLSGHAVSQLAQYFKIDWPEVLIVVDEAQLELGRLRARPSGSAGGHNGLKSLIEQLGTHEFPRLRVGVGRGDSRRDLGDHVLAKFDPDERAIVEEAVTRAADAAELFVHDGIAAVMNRFNRKKEASEDTTEDRD